MWGYFVLLFHALLREFASFQEASVGQILYLAKHVLFLYDQNEELRIALAAEQSKTASQEELLKQNSRNSSRPPSTDRFPAKSAGTKEKKRAGGREGHKGHTRTQKDIPNATVTHPVCTCKNCGKDLSNSTAETVHKRQVWDIPPNILLQVTEHVAEEKTCPQCKAKNFGTFPEDVTAPVQFGTNIRALAVYLHQFHGIPYKRLEELLKAIFGDAPCAATLESTQGRIATQLKAYVDQIHDHIQAQNVTHADETGIKVDGKTQWVHVHATQDATHYLVSEKRGKAGMDPHLQAYAGVLVHDHWASYFTFDDIVHALCNAHIIRELTFLSEVRDCQWAGQLKTFLQDLHNEVKEAKAAGLTSFPPQAREQRFARYNELVEKGLSEHPPPEKKKGQKGRVKKSKERNLLERLQKFAGSFLLFVDNFDVPFDNNQAERDLRMLKVLLKVYGCFRSLKGAQEHAIIRSFLSTCQKQKFDILQAICLVIRGEFKWNFAS